MSDQKPPESLVNIDVLTRAFPRTAVKNRQGMDYVEGHTVIHRLNEATGNCWEFVVKDIASSVAGKDKDGADIVLMRAHVALTLPGLGTREHIGVQAVRAKGGEDLVKGCVTDALKKAATLFGVALELYGPDYEGAPPTAATSAPRAPANERRSPQSAPEPPIDREKVIHRLHSYVPHDALHNWAANNGVASLAEVSTDDLIALGKSFKTGGATAFMAQHAPPAGQSSIDGLDDLHAQLDRDKIAERARQ